MGISHNNGMNQLTVSLSLSQVGPHGVIGHPPFSTSVLSTRFCKFTDELTVDLLHLTM